MSTLPRPRCCVVCSDVTLGVHFGVDACRACTAFFRRSVTNNRHYYCKNEGKCTIDKDIRNCCRKCRLQKCFDLGMKPESIQPKRNKTVVQTEDVERNIYCISPASENEFPTSPSTSTLPNDMPTTYKYPLLTKTLENYRILRSTRRNTELELDPSISKNMVPIGPLEGLSLGTAGQMSKFFKAHIPAVSEFLGSTYEEFAALDNDEKWHFLRNFLVPFWWLDSGFRTLQKIPRDHFHKICLLSETTYFDVDRSEDWIKDITDLPVFHEGLSGLAKKTMSSDNMKSMYKMHDLQLKEEEEMAIIGLILWNNTAEGLTESMCQLVTKMRAVIFEELYDFYKKTEVAFPATRLGEILDLYNTAIVELIRCRESLELFTVLDGVKEDTVFYAMVKWTQ